jgi:hypothetical protein
MKNLPSNIYHRLSSFSAATPSRINVESIPSVLKTKFISLIHNTIFINQIYHSCVKSSNAPYNCPIVIDFGLRIEV